MAFLLGLHVVDMVIQQRTPSEERQPLFVFCLSSGSGKQHEKYKKRWSAKSNGVTITLPSETEAGSAGMQPCRGIAWWAHRDDGAQRENHPLALPLKITLHRIERPPCLENPNRPWAQCSQPQNAFSLHFPLNQNSLRLAAMRGRLSTCGRLLIGPRLGSRHVGGRLTILTIGRRMPSCPT